MTKTIANNTVMIKEVSGNPSLKLNIMKSAAVSPTVVDIIFISQKIRVISGTLLNILRGFEGLFDTLAKGGNVES